MKRFQFSGRVAVVTGGTSGIGAQVAKDLAALGARVAVCGLQPPSFEAGEIYSRVCDIRDDRAVTEFFADVARLYGPVDLLINNAGAAVYRSFEESSTAEVLDILDVNLGGAFRCAKAVLPDMIARRQGTIVNIASIGGELIITPNAAYCAAKHGMVAWTRAIRYELDRFNVSVLAVCPDHVRTRFQDHPTFRRRDRHRKYKKGSLTVETVSAAILRAIEKNRALTYVPGWLGAVVWAFHSVPWLMRPLWARLIAARMEELYSEIEREQLTTAGSASSAEAPPTVETSHY